MVPASRTDRRAPLPQRSWPRREDRRGVVLGPRRLRRDEVPLPLLDLSRAFRHPPRPHRGDSRASKALALARRHGVRPLPRDRRARPGLGRCAPAPRPLRTPLPREVRPAARTSSRGRRRSRLRLDPGSRSPTPRTSRRRLRPRDGGRPGDGRRDLLGRTAGRQDPGSHWGSPRTWNRRLPPRQRATPSAPLSSRPAASPPWRSPGDGGSPEPSPSSP